MYLHTELVRLLEQRGHLFSTDPILITEQLSNKKNDFTERLHHRAERIDADHSLAERLRLYDHRSRLILSVATILWFAFGLIGTYGLMQQRNLNFMPVLASALGINTVMLIWWFGSILLHRKRHIGWLNPELFWRHTDTVSQTIAKLYTDTFSRADFIWYRGQITHRLSLAALCGMFFAALFLLTVRQYSFNWESTLLGGAAFAKTIAVLSWLPEKLGLPVPDTAAVLANRNHADEVYAAHWGGLLLGSIVCYGIMPRLAAWLWCKRRVHNNPPQLDLSLPYYQGIIVQWQRQITDKADDFQADPIAPISIPNTVNIKQFWAIALDAPDIPSNWFANLSNGNLWEDKGMVTDREDMARLSDCMAAQSNNVRLLIAVRAHTVPDRGVIRRLVKLSEQANGGIMLHLSGANPPNETLQQWHQACSEHGWETI